MTAQGNMTSEEADRLFPGASLHREPRGMPRGSLRELARRPHAERHRVLADARIAVEPDVTDAWDETLADRIH